ncbi:MAG TPA: oligopeptide:H+ symporter [Micromonosporaceae bacterium]|nr:oligopeptide:H+ symporter [Micromonosporaceae bacterium]
MTTMDTGRAPAAVSLRRMPPWYRTLFWVDALERFGFYGMSAILLLFASAPRAEGGLGMSTADGGSLFGVWISLMFMLSLLGGWLGDRVFGHRRALVVGAAVSTAGYACLATPTTWMVAIGLCATALGGAIFKPNHQALVNRMFDDRRGRESGISLMYVGTQLSALLAPLVAGFVGERVNWQLGFLCAALTMIVTTFWLTSTTRQFGGVGDRPIRPLNADERRTAGRRTVITGLAVALVLIGLGVRGKLTPLVAIALIGLLSIFLTIAGYVWLYRNPLLRPSDRRRLRAFLWVYLGATLFWMINAQAGSVLTAFARDETDRDVLGWLVPSAWMQSVTPLFMLFLAPVAASMLPRYGRRHALAGRFSLGLLLAGASFLVMAVAAALAAGDAKVSPMWLVACYLITAVAELIIAAISISACADVLPAQFLGRVMGLYWLFAAVGGGFGNGALAQVAASAPLDGYFTVVGGVAVLVGLAFVLLRRRLTEALAKDPDEAPSPARQESLITT